MFVFRDDDIRVGLLTNTKAGLVGPPLVSFQMTRYQPKLRSRPGRSLASTLSTDVASPIGRAVHNTDRGYSTDLEDCTDALMQSGT